MRVLLVHSDDRPFEVGRFGAAWEGAGGARAELVPITPSTGANLLRDPKRIAGVILTGGPDVVPSRYGAVAEAGVRLSCQPARDALDFDVLERAFAGGWPVLAVCYGCQVLNVWRGGTLIQDLPAAGLEGHSVRLEGHLERCAHSVAIAASTRHLGWAPPVVPVNSRHHQGVAEVGAGLLVTATAPDGVIEALEGTDPEHWVVGVQWHPENILAGVHRELFARFRAACLNAAGQRRTAFARRDIRGVPG